MSLAGATVRRVDAAVAAYLAVAVLALVQVVVLGDAARAVRGVVPYVAAGAAVVVARRLAPASDEQAEAWIKVLAGAGVALSAWILGAFAVALPQGLGQPAGFYTVKALIATPVGDHNTAAGLLLPAVVAAAAASARNRGWAVGLAVTALGLAATLSRGAAVVLLVVAAAGWFLVGDKALRRRLFVAAAGSLALVLVAAWWLGADPPQGVPEVDGPVGASVVARGDLIVRGVEVGARQPVLGVGFGGFADEAADLPPPNHHAHNAVAHGLAEGGIALALVAVALPLLLLVRLVRMGPGHLRDVLALGGAALVLQAQHDIMGGLAGYEVLLAVMIGLAGGAHEASDQGGAPIVRRRGG